MRDPLRAFDAWLFGGGTPDAAVRAERAARALALVLGLRIVLGPYRDLAGQPATLFRPPPLLELFSHMPSWRVFLALQLLAAAAALLAMIRPNRYALALAWLGLLVLAGLRGSLGKILHNDVLLLLTVFPFVVHSLVGATKKDGPWQTRSALLVVSAAYFFAGYQKLMHSGLEWVFSDNFRWILYGGAASGRAPIPDVARFIADRPALAVASAAILLTLELSFPLVLLVRRLRPVYGVVAIGMHAGTWLTLGLDYWGWVAVDVVILLYAAAARPAVVARQARAA